jgi:hypothetical protein
MLSWTEELRRVAMAVSKKDRNPPLHRQQLFYLLLWTADARGFGVTVHKGRDPESADELWAIDRALSKPPRFVSDDDRVRSCACCGPSALSTPACAPSASGLATAARCCS